MNRQWWYLEWINRSAIGKNRKWTHKIQTEIEMVVTSFCVGKSTLNKLTESSVSCTPWATWNGKQAPDNNDWEIIEYKRKRQKQKQKQKFKPEKKTRKKEKKIKMTRKCPKKQFIANKKQQADGKVIVFHGACKTLFLESNQFGEIGRTHNIVHAVCCFLACSCTVLNDRFFVFHVWMPAIKYMYGRVLCYVCASNSNKMK